MIKLKGTKLFDAYIISLVLIAAFIGVIAFVVVWISPETLFKVIHRVTYGEITLKQGIEWLCFEVPTILGKAIPVGLLLGTLVITDMLSRNFELVIFRSIGISFARLARPVIILSCILGIFCFFAANSLIPYSAQKVEQIKSGGTREDIQWSYLEKDNENNPLQLIIVSNTNGDYLKNINVFQIEPRAHDDADASIKNIIFAKSGQFETDKLTINDVTIYELLPTGIYKDIKHVDSKVILSGKNAINANKLLQTYDVKPDEMTRAKLKEHLKLLKEEHIQDEYNANLNNLYQRVSQALICIVFAISGLVLGWSRPRENRFIGFTIGALIIFGYYLTFPFINMLAEKSMLPPIITAFLPLIIISIGIFIYAKSKDL